MSEAQKIINIPGYENYAHIRIDWGPEDLTLRTLGHDGELQSLTFGLETLDELLDTLHQARREIAKVKRIARILRLPATLNDALEESTRRDGISRNAAIIEAIESYLVE